MNSSTRRDFAAELSALDARVNAFLPPRYQHCYSEVAPTSMGSASLKYGPDGKVAWDQVWTTFCDLALAGGPPHRGKLMEPVAEAEVQAHPRQYADVVAELDRAIGLTSGVPVSQGYAPGWIGIPCKTQAEAAWLQFAVNAENVSARRRGNVLQLPAGPAFRAEKEIKNVVVALAKAIHYWDGHLTDAQQTLAGQGAWEPPSPAEAAANPAEYEAAMGELENALRDAGMTVSPRRYTGWVGVETPGEEEAVWLLRAVLVEPALARREEHVLYLPINLNPEPGRTVRVVAAVTRAWELWQASRTARRPTWRASDRPR
ncbi:hypothetical protein [Singulisphaera sp. PoT]|uniref:hypothetical protein n=1 Tax=Singulisphaera sp. PoT TaxID=3411797 RepID=UPI003BF5904E